MAEGDAITLARAAFSIDFDPSWAATLFVDNLNNEKGVAVKGFPGVDDWNARVRPRTVGLQLDYRFR